MATNQNFASEALEDGDVLRDTFAERQAAMSARWYENVQQRGNVEGYLAQRKAAYLQRWKEATRYLPDGAKILDIGGGNLFSELLEYLKLRGFDYWYIDVDPAAVFSSRLLAVEAGMNGHQFAQGFNDKLRYDDASFDAIFSSHCIEHSFDLAQTFREVHRVLAKGGLLLMAVPLGWEENPEHPYFFATDDWLTLVQDAGFDVFTIQISSEYPEHGVDLLLGARRRDSEAAIMRINPNDYMKASYKFLSLKDAAISYNGNCKTVDGMMIFTGMDWCVTVKLPPGIEEVLPIVARHDWSAIVEFSSDVSSIYADLYSWFPFVQPVRLKVSSRPHEVISLRPVGRNSASRGSEAVLVGFMHR